MTSFIQPEHSPRFEFGKNWKRFSRLINEERIRKAEASLREMLQTKYLRGLKFLDIGCGSGLFSLAASRLGAEVRSFDYDIEAVECAQELKRRYRPDAADWQIEKGTILDDRYVASLGKYDIVYSWGVLHHTGAMWQALEKACATVAPMGLLYVSIYNDQGGASRRWLAVKQIHGHLPKFLRWALALAVAFYFETRYALVRVVTGRPLFFHDKERGMSVLYDWVDWVGGYPFEASKPEDVFDFCGKRGFTLVRLKTAGGGHGCNEFAFQKSG